MMILMTIIYERTDLFFHQSIRIITSIAKKRKFRIVMIGENGVNLQTSASQRDVRLIPPY